MDKYAAAVAYLSDRPDEINAAWNGPKSHPAGCLFGYVSKDGEGGGWGDGCGCLTQVRSGFYEACTPELTEEIRADERIPKDVAGITPESLNVFAEWQRKLDVLLGRS